MTALNSTDELLAPIYRFLSCATPAPWIDSAVAQENQSTLLVDHANCEKKAASTALNLMYRYVDNFELLNKMSKLAREELRHFEQVIKIMKKRGIAYTPLSASRYAGGMREGMRSHEPEKLVDTLIIGAFIEARSCERFARVAPLLDSELGEFYQSLLKSEARHYEDYLTLARKVSPVDIEERVTYYAALERRLIETPDREFRFHSGPIVVTAGV